LQNGTHSVKRGTADEPTYGRILAPCKAETSRMKNVLIESSGEKTIYLG
jgi:hypothetical protein